MESAAGYARHATHEWKEGMLRSGIKISGEAEKKFFEACVRDYQLRLENPLPPRGPRGCEMNWERMRLLGEARHRESVGRKKQG
mgnify:CR=1 FL=1